MQTTDHVTSLVENTNSIKKIDLITLGSYV